MIPKYRKETIRKYFKAIEINSLDKNLKSRIIRATVQFATEDLFDKTKSFYPMCFSDWRNLIDLMGNADLESKYLVGNWKKNHDI